MKTLALLTLAALSLCATPITDPTPVVSSTCSVGGAQVGCGPSWNPSAYGSDLVGTDAYFSMTGLNTNSGLFIHIGTQATAGTTGITSLSLGSSALSSSVLDFFANTDGPQREGFATYTVRTDKDHGGDGGGYGNPLSSIAGLGECHIQACSKSSTLTPFELGVPFEIIASAISSGGSGKHSLESASADSWVFLQLFESSGAPVVIFDPPAPVPEPSTLWLLGFGLYLVVLYSHRSRHIGNKNTESLHLDDAVFFPLTKPAAGGVEVKP